MSDKPKYHDAAHYAAILRDRATMKRHLKPDGYNGLAANYEAAADMLDSLSSEGGPSWQPIETAPKDGTEILGWRDDCGCLLIRWACAEEFLNDGEIESGDWSDDALFEEDWFYADFISGGRLEGSEAPTHWMPMPKAPASDKRSSDD